MNKRNHVPHYRPFVLGYAKKGAPFGTIDGRKAEILHWDLRGGTCHILGIVDDDFGGDLSVRWDSAGMPHADRTMAERLIMLPQGECEGKPVFAGDELWDPMADEGEQLFKVSVYARDFSRYIWPPKPTVCDMEPTATGFKMFGKEYVQIEMLNVVAEAVYRDMQARAKVKADSFGITHVCMPRGIDIPGIVKRVLEGK